ncbi:hypothetical protein D770_14505 [Flammeovirgaceae bacterium 311]|nr:hypothetical protein D770_14505 [Flammeovirgaceae bacterium 311]
MAHHHSRRDFIKTTASIGCGALLANLWPGDLLAAVSSKIRLSGQLWVYASRYPPNWDCTPILEEIFSDFQYAGLPGVEIIGQLLRHADVVERIGALSEKYGVAVTGSAIGGEMWNREKHQMILEDVEPIIERLHRLGGATFSMNVGNPNRRKTDKELDAQADLLKRIIKICEQKEIQANLHNHDFEMKEDLYEFKGIIDRVPELKLGPDINWLVRAGIDPVYFIETYGHKIVHLHIRDQHANGKWSEAVGEGVTDFRAIAKALRKANFQGRAVVELDFDDPPVRPVKENLRISAAYVKKVLKQV